MATKKALVIVAGATSQIADADTLNTGAGITSAGSSDLSLGAGGANVSLVANKNLTGTAGTGNVDFSGMTGTFSTCTGAGTLNGDTTVATGKTLACAGTGNINLPNNGSAIFKIEGVSCSANVTAANLGTLTAGAASDASALHTHNGSAIGGLTTSGLADGDFGYISSALTVSKTDALAFASSLCIGANEGTAGAMTIDGIVEDAKFTTDGLSPDNGANVYLAEATADGNTGAGKLTATAPTAAGSQVAAVGICLDNTNYAGAKTAKVLMQVKTVVTL